MSSIPVIQTTGLSIGYPLKGGKKKLVHSELSLALYPGEVTCLLGLNGAGKSTLLRTLCGFQPLLGGEIEVMGKSLSDYSRRDFSLTVGVVLTEKTNAGGITVYELVSLGRHPYTGFFGQLKEEDKRIIEHSLDAVGIMHKAHNYVSELSDGERQKAMIAKTLAQQCPIILLDEPTAFLDITSRIETMVLLRKLAVEQGKAILLSTHDLDLAIQMGDCLWLLEKGKPLASGTPEDLIMSGSFESFFDKEGLVFDRSTGKLNRVAPVQPVGVEGDFLTSYWVGNALIRMGYKPSSVSNKYISVSCHSPEEMLLVYPDKASRTVGSVVELMKELKESNDENKRNNQETGE